MKEEILKRAMFAMPLSKDARNSGILSGFDMEDMDEMSGEMPEPGEEMPQMARNPQNPEILMNNLRGDMRSVDARYMELAQMVGEEAAMETPPEVLAMLQPQLAQQGGIGALPQAQGMVPPPMAPQQPPMAQGPEMAMPQGMAGAGPFPSGGAEQAPPTPDGLPPMKAALGAFITPGTRLMQMGADKLGTLATGANIVGGRLMSQGFPQVFRPIFENVKGPGGRYTAEQFLTYPTLTQHLSNLVGPQVTSAATRFTPGAPAVVGGTGVLAAIGLGQKPEGVDAERQALLKAYEEAYYQTRDKSIPMPVLRDRTNEQLAQDVQTLQGQATPAPAPAPTKTPAPVVAPPVTATKAEEPAAEAPATEDTTQSFIKANLATPKVESTKDRITRIKEAQAEYAPLYKELLGDTKEDMYVNAMLMLADAGFRYAGMPAKTGTTPLSRLGQAAQGIPQGFMALLAQAKDRQMKVDTAALSQAVSDIQEQDKYAQQLRMEMLKGDYRLLSEQIKQGGAIEEHLGGGHIAVKTKNGSYKGTYIDPNNPTVKAAVSSRWTLRPTDNPFVENRGEAPTSPVSTKEEVSQLTGTLRALDNSLSTLDNLKGVYSRAYGPGAWFSDKVNNLLVPVLPSAVVRPDVDLKDASTRISTGMNAILKNIASANDSGRVAVQEQEWVRETAQGITDPTKFFADKELAAKQFNSMEAMLRNARQQVLTQLGYEKNDFVMNTPNTGTKSDPFIMPSDPESQQRMMRFLGSTVGKIQDPRATVYVRMPNNTVQAFNPTQLKGLVQ